MNSIKDIRSDYQQLSLLEKVTNAYAEIAAFRMQRTRSKVVNVRDFLYEIFTVFEEVRQNYIKSGIEKKGKKITFLSHNGKTVAVLLSSNAGLYGDIVKRTFDSFSAGIKDRDCEITIVGRQGAQLFKNKYPGRPFTYFDIPDFASSTSFLSPLIKHIVKYSEVNLYYSRFDNVLVQKPDVAVMSSDIAISQLIKNPIQAKNYWFEPNMEAILAFFESEIFGSVFRQTLSESELAKLGSRIVAMNRANEKIVEERKRVRSRAMLATHQVNDRKQRNNVSILMLHLG